MRVGRDAVLAILLGSLSFTNSYVSCLEGVLVSEVNTQWVTSGIE